MTKGRKRKNGTIAEQIFEPATLAKIAGWLEVAGVDSIEIETEGGRLLRIVAGAGTASDGAGEAPDVSISQDDARPAKAPIAGHFLPLHPAREAAEATVGSAVLAEEIIGFVGIGPLIMPIHAEDAGTLNDCVVEPGSLVGYGDTVFLIEPAK